MAGRWTLGVSLGGLAGQTIFR